MDKLQCKENREKHCAILDLKRGPPKKKKTHESTETPLVKKKKQDSPPNQQNQEGIKKYIRLKKPKIIAKTKD